MNKTAHSDCVRLSNQTSDDQFPRSGVGNLNFGFWLHPSLDQPFPLQPDLKDHLLSIIVADIPNSERALLEFGWTLHACFPLHQPSSQRWEYQLRPFFCHSVISML